MIEYITINQKPENGCIKFDLLKNYDYIGLVDITFNGIQFSGRTYTVIDMVVDEIDKTAYNPHRLFSRFLYNYCKSSRFYKTEFNPIQWKKLDSTDKQLNMKFYDEYGEPVKFRTYRSSNGTILYDQLQITIALADNSPPEIIR